MTKMSKVLLSRAYQLSISRFDNTLSCNFSPFIIIIIINEINLVKGYQCNLIKTSRSMESRLNIGTKPTPPRHHLRLDSRTLQQAHDPSRWHDSITPCCTWCRPQWGSRHWLHSQCLESTRSWYHSSTFLQSVSPWSIRHMYYTTYCQQHTSPHQQSMAQCPARTRTPAPCGWPGTPGTAPAPAGC